MTSDIRINRYLAAAGLGSRRKCEQLVLEGRVVLNGERIKDLHRRVDPENDVVTVDGKRVSMGRETVVLILNKPAGVLSTVEDDFGRKTVLDLAAEEGFGTRLFPVGRLDLETSGLILLTNDGDLAYRLTHPGYKIEKTYLATVEGMLSDEDAEMIGAGVKLDDGYTTMPCSIEVLDRDEAESRVKVVVKEGKKRQIRRMFAGSGHKVLHLHRCAIGDLGFDDLEEGRMRRLSKAEENRLRELTGLLNKE